MSHCTILIIKKSETSKIQDSIRSLRDRLPISADNVLTRYYKQSDFVHISSIYSSFEDYDVLMIEDYHSSFANYRTKFDIEKDKKIEKYRKRGWSESKIQDWIDAQIKKNDSHLLGKNHMICIRKIIFELARDYDVAFAYYWQEKKWNGFKDIQIITKPQESYEENIIYQIKNEK